MRSLVPGTLVDRYELVSPVGEGGMAQVWVARQRGKHGFEKLFAFKCIHDRFADVPAFRSMFLDEARIAAAIEHPNVAQVFDLGESGSMLYLVIEYVDGESLGALMTAASRRANAAITVPTPVALRIIADACAGLHAAHRLKDAEGNTRGVVHRDVSPQNLLVSVKGDVKVIDFGIAHAKDRIGGDTGEGSLKGKLHYMAPEQALREDIGPFTDVFAVGATLYRMLAGRPPFDGGNDAATLHMLLSGSPPAPLPDTVPPLVAAIVERALSFDPGDRYGSAMAMQTALEQAISEEGYVPDVATWVMQNASDAAQERRAQLATRTMNIRPSSHDAGPSFDAELGPLPSSGTLRAAPVAPAAAAPSSLELAVSAPRVEAAAPARDPSADLEERSVMDIRALVARAGSQPKPEFTHAPDGPMPPAPPMPRMDPAATSARRVAATASSPSSSGSSSSSSSSEPPERHAANARDVDYVGPSTRPKPLGAGATASGWVKLAALAVAVVLVLAGLLLLLPMIVQGRIIAGAREAGVELTIDRLGIGFGNLSLKGVTATCARVPGDTARADDIFVTGFAARELRVRGLDVTLNGAAADVGSALAALADQNRARFAGTAAEPRKLDVIAAHVLWKGLLGDGTQLDVRDLTTEIESRGIGLEDLRASVSGFDVKAKHTTFGPWAGSFDRTAGSSRARLLFDPPVPDGPSALVFWTRTSPPHLTVNVVRSPLARLGIRLEDLGLVADPATEAQLKLELGQNPMMRFEGTGRLDLFNARVKGLKGPVDIKVEGAADGTAGKPLDLQKTTVTVGPIVANVSGTVTATDQGFRLDASWRTVPVTCEKLARAEAKSMGPFAAALQDLAHSSGVARVTGTATASGVVRYDTKVPDEAATTLLTHETCGLSIFGM